MLNRRERFIAAAAALVLAALMIDRLLVAPLLQRKEDADERLVAVQEALSRAEVLFRSEVAARRRWNELAGGSLQDDAPAAESQVLNLVRDWGQQAGLALTSLKPERNPREMGFGRITVRATGHGTLQQVSRFLHEVENAAIPLRISDLQISARRDGMDDLALQIGVSTIYLPSAEAGATEARR